MHGTCDIESYLKFVCACIGIPNQEGYRSPYALLFVSVSALVSLAQVDYSQHQIQERALFKIQMLIKKKIVLVC